MATAFNDNLFWYWIFAAIIQILHAFYVAEGIYRMLKSRATDTSLLGIACHALMYNSAYEKLRRTIFHPVMYVGVIVILISISPLTCPVIIAHLIRKQLWKTKSERRLNKNEIEDRNQVNKGKKKSSIGLTSEQIEQLSWAKRDWL